MHRSKLVFLTVLSLVLIAVPTKAFWGANGHRIVGLIAERHLSVDASRAVQTLLGTESLARAATWPDEVRSDSRWDFAAPWHYINLEDDQTFDTAPRADEGDILQALGCFEQVLRDDQAARADKVVAIRYLVHLVGDLHQPLHVGRGSDRGANSVRVQLFRDNTNLHSVWDSGLLESEHLSYSEFAEFIDHPDSARIQALQQGTYRDWAQESFDLRSLAYQFAPGNPPRLSYDYAFEKLPIVRRRLMEGGVRLAAVLNSIYDPTPSSPTDWSDPQDRQISHVSCADLGTRLGTD